MRLRNFLKAMQNSQWFRDGNGRLRNHNCKCPIEAVFRLPKDTNAPVLRAVCQDATINYGAAIITTADGIVLDSHHAYENMYALRARCYTKPLDFDTMNIFRRTERHEIKSVRKSQLEFAERCHRTPWIEKLTALDPETCTGQQIMDIISPGNTWDVLRFYCDCCKVRVVVITEFYTTPETVEICDECLASAFDLMKGVKAS